jgi:hypothetical protein
MHDGKDEGQNDTRKQYQCYYALNIVYWDAREMNKVANSSATSICSNSTLGRPARQVDGTYCTAILAEFCQIRTIDTRKVSATFAI